MILVRTLDGASQFLWQPCLEYPIWIGTENVSAVTGLLEGAFRTLQDLHDPARQFVKDQARPCRF